MSIPYVGRMWRWLAVLLWMGLIFLISAQADLPHHPQETWDLILKKLGHFCEYGILAALAFWALVQDGESVRTREILAAFAFAAVYALSDEIHQHFVPGRDPRLMDVAVDLVGAGVALLAMSRVFLSRDWRPGR
jgi:VanZ family protein